MSYKAKNGLYLAILLLIIGGIVYYQLNKLNKEIEPIVVLLNRTKREIADPKYFKPDTLRVHWMVERTKYMENWTLENSKFFLAEDTSRITWEYLQEIVKRFDENFQFNFQTITARNQQDYNISGTVKSMYLYVFINYIEKLGALYTIESISLSNRFRDTDDGPSNDVSFSMLIRPRVDRAAGKKLNETPLRRINYDYIMKDPFRPAIYYPMRDPAQEQYIDYEKLELIGYSGNQGYFSGERQSVISLTSMQRVSYGYFSHIDQRNNRAVFRINKTGLYENVYKYLK